MMSNSQIESFDASSRSNTGARISKSAIYLISAIGFTFSLIVGSIFAYGFHGLTGLAICGLVWLVVVGSALVAVLVSNLLASPVMMQSQLFVGMGIRCGVPLVFTVGVVLFAKSWLDYGCIYYLLAFYFVGLILDVLLLLGTVSFDSKSTVSAPNARSAVGR